MTMRGLPAVMVTRNSWVSANTGEQGTSRLLQRLIPFPEQLEEQLAGMVQIADIDTGLRPLQLAGRGVLTLQAVEVHFQGLDLQGLGITHEAVEKLIVQVQ